MQASFSSICFIISEIEKPIKLKIGSVFDSDELGSVITHVKYDIRISIFAPNIVLI